MMAASTSLQAALEILTSIQVPFERGRTHANQRFTACAPLLRHLQGQGEIRVHQGTAAIDRKRLSRHKAGFLTAQ